MPITVDIKPRSAPSSADQSKARSLGSDAGKDSQPLSSSSGSSLGQGEGESIHAEVPPLPSTADLDIPSRPTTTGSSVHRQLPTAKRQPMEFFQDRAVTPGSDLESSQWAGVSLGSMSEFGGRPSSRGLSEAELSLRPRSSASWVSSRDVSYLSFPMFSFFLSFVS